MKVAEIVEGNYYVVKAPRSHADVRKARVITVGLGPKSRFATNPDANGLARGRVSVDYGEQIEQSWMRFRVIQASMIVEPWTARMDEEVAAEKAKRAASVAHERAKTARRWYPTLYDFIDGVLREKWDRGNGRNAELFAIGAQLLMDLDAKAPRGDS